MLNSPVTNLVWSGLEYDSIEHCEVTTRKDVIDINSTILGHYRNKIYKVRYEITGDDQWRTHSVRVISKINGVERDLRLQSDGDGTWTHNGKHDDAFNTCFEVDLPLTPFTNTLPINRLRMKLNDTALIKVIYIDLLEDSIRPVVQKYVRISENEYRYENVPNDFEAVIKVDGSGFVQEYPGLFRRVAPIDVK